MKGYASFGKGDRDLVIFPGLAVRDVTEDMPMLEKVFRMFTEEWRVHVIDRPQEVPDGTTNRDLAHTHAEFLIQQGITDADIIGISQGGMIAQHLAVDYPELVHRLVLGSTMSEMNSTAQHTFDTWFELAESGKWDEMVHDMMNRLYTDRYLGKYSAAVDMLARTLRPDDAHRFLNLVRACMTAGPENLEGITCPTLVMGAEEDLVLTGQASRDIAEKLGCELFMYSGFRHAVYDESSDFYYRAQEFLKKA